MSKLKTNERGAKSGRDYRIELQLQINVRLKAQFNYDNKNTI